MRRRSSSGVDWVEFMTWLCRFVLPLFRHFFLFFFFKYFLSIVAVKGWCWHRPAAPLRRTKEFKHCWMFRSVTFSFTLIFLLCSFDSADFFFKRFDNFCLILKTKTSHAMHAHVHANVPYYFMKFFGRLF